MTITGGGGENEFRVIFHDGGLVTVTDFSAGDTLDLSGCPTATSFESLNVVYLDVPTAPWWRVAYQLRL